MDPVATRRLRLRTWQPEDLAPFAAMNADPRVMEYLPKVLSRAESDVLAARIAEHFSRHGFGLWAVEVLGVTDFAGFVGLSVPTFDAPFMPCVEVGWRLGYKHWGHGYATEATAAALEFAFERLGLAQVVSFTVASNLRSRRVMERAGMERAVNEDFDHPNLAEGSPLRRHVLYKLSRTSWEASRRVL